MLVRSPTDPLRNLPSNIDMDADWTPRIIEVERVKRGLLIMFDNGAQAIYPADLLYQFLYVAEKMIEENAEGELE